MTDLLVASEGQRPRVQVWLDRGLVQWKPDLVERLECQFRNESPGIEFLHPVRTIPGGECIKNDPVWVDRILRAIHDDNLDRRSYVVAIGGGAVLDAVGFAAAVAHRGIRLIRFPSTTLAQADSGVGVKNAVNAFDKKNWKGTFSVPWAVINDQRLLHGLSDRDFRCGFSEAVKVSLLKSPSEFLRLSESADRIADRHMPSALQAIRSSVLLHLRHITEGGDPFESLEARPLDFGHWSAHKLEGLSGYRLRHGEAVSIGLALDCVYSTLALGLPFAIADKAIATLQRLRLPIYDPLLTSDQIFSGLEEFRQHLGGRLTLTMLRGLGESVDIHRVDFPKMVEAIGRLQVIATQRSLVLL